MSGSGSGATDGAPFDGNESREAGIGRTSVATSAGGLRSTAWTGMVPVDDTALAVTDTGPGVPMVYLNGHMASQWNRRRVIAEPGTGWRHITHDMRARGKSKRSADYSFEASLSRVTARNPNIKIYAKVVSSHGSILREYFRAVAGAVRGTVAVHATKGA